MSLGTGRWVAGPWEVAALAEFNGRTITAVGHSGYLHPGDVFHRTFGGNRHLDPSSFLHVWEDATGITAWLMLQPRHGGWDLQVRPDLRDPLLEAELIEWSVEALLVLLAESDTNLDRVVVGAFADDSVRIEALERGGWLRGNDPYFITERSTRLPLPVELPPGYFVRPAGGRRPPPSVSCIRPRLGPIGDQVDTPDIWAIRAIPRNTSCWR